MYQLIALDMDGTLLNKDKKISEKTHESIKALKEKGKKVVLATGRPYNGVKRYIKELDLLDEDDYVVTYNGALVQSTKDSRVLLDVPLNVAAYKELYEVAKSLDVNIHALTDRSVMTPRDNPYTGIESRINEIPTIERPVEDTPEDELIVKVMFIDDPEKLDEIIPKIPEWVKEKYSILRSAPYFLEFLDPRVNKGAGVHAIAKALGLKQQQVICVGDAGNDIAMIEYAEIGVAMGNASEDVKEIADYITKTNCQDGVAHVIDKFMLSAEYTA